MADILVENQKNALVAADLPQSVGSKLLMEANLLGGGIKDGFLNRKDQSIDNLGWTALEFAGTAAIGAGLTLMQQAGGRWGTAARVATQGLKVLAIGDGIRRLAPTVYSMADTWVNPENYAENRATIGKYLGSAFFDYPLMAAGGFVGSAGAQRALSHWRGGLPENFNIPKDISAKWDPRIIKEPGINNPKILEHLQNQAAPKVDWSLGKGKDFPTFNNADLGKFPPSRILGELKSIDGLGMRYNTINIEPLIQSRISMSSRTLPIIPLPLVDRQELFLKNNAAKLIEQKDVKGLHQWFLDNAIENAQKK